MYAFKVATCSPEEIAKADTDSGYSPAEVFHAPIVVEDECDVEAAFKAARDSYPEGAYLTGTWDEIN